MEEACRCYIGGMVFNWVFGRGMLHAWLSGKALADMMLGREVEGKLGEWFPDMMGVTEKTGIR